MLESQTFTPSWLAQLPDHERPKFTLRPGTVLERDRFEAELEGKYRAGAVMSFHLMMAAANGIQALVPGEEGAALVELIRAEFGEEELSPAEKAKVKAATEVLAQHWPEYASLVEQEAQRNTILPTLAFIRWCDGWESVKDKDGVTIAYARDPLGQIDEAALRRVPPLLMRAAGMEAYGLQYGRTQAKNSAPLSNSSPRRKGNSSSRGGSKAVGKSATTTSKKTPRSRRRAGPAA